MVLARVGDDVQGGHDQACTVADDAHFAVQLDVVQAVGLGLGLQRIGYGLVLQLFVLRVTDLGGVVIQRNLAVQGNDVPGAGLHQRVDLDQGGILFLEDNPQLLQGLGDLAAQFLGEAGSLDDLGGLGCVNTNQRVNGDAGQGFRALFGQLLDLHAAFHRAHGQVVAVGTVQQHREVVLFGDVGTLGDHDLVHGVALDVHTEDVLCVLEGLIGGLGDLYATGLATAADLDLSLDNNDAANLLCGGLGFLGSVGDDAGKHGNAVCLEKIARLVFIQVHGYVSFVRSSS